MSKIISVVNQKGGVGKTTTAVNLGAYLAQAGKFVLLVDLDPQANATSGLGIDHNNLDKGLYEALMGEHQLHNILINTNHDGYRLAPATQNLAGAGVELVNMENREFKLQAILEQVKQHYDYIIIDCPPSLGLITINGLTAADNVLIPVQAEYYALEGLSQLLKTIQLVQENLKPELDILGAVVTMFDKRTKLSDQVMQELQQHFPNKIFSSVIPRNVRLSEAPSYGQTILEYDKWSKGGRAYEKLAEEIIEMESAG